MTKKKIARIAVLVSGGGTNLQALIDAQKSGVLKSGKIAVVISDNASAYALTRAAEANIDTAVVKKERLEDAITELLNEYKIDLIVLAGFMRILSSEFVQRYPHRIINVHPSLIPSFCGKGYYGIKVHEAALAYGVKVSGATVHYVNEVPDGGEIILQKAVMVGAHDTPQALQRRVMRMAEWKILPRAAELVCRELI